VTTPSPAKLEELLARLNRKPDPAQHAELESVLVAATEAAEEWRNTGPIVARTVTERVYTNDRGRLVLTRRPVQSITSATRVLDAVVVAGADLDFDPLSGIIAGKTVALAGGGYDVEYQAGRGAVDEVEERFKRAVLEIAAHMWQTQRGPGTRSFVGSESEQSGGGFRVGSGYLIPNRAATLLGGGTVVVM
jgi:hypothetical protein